MEVVVGTYEELILAYKLVSGDQGYEFELSFTDHSHTGCVRSVATSERGTLASGSSDEVIRLFNLRKHSEIGSLMHHNGIITGVHFHKMSHMFSTSADGTIGVWKMKNWECLRTLHGHKGAVTSVSVHPSGKMALSVGQDKKLCIWNLMTGKRAFVSNLKQVGDHVLWSPDGSTYLVVVNNRVDIYDMATAEVKETIQITGRINHIEFIKANIVMFGGEEGKLQIHDIENNKILLDHSTNTTRIKGFSWCEDPDKPEGLLLVTASSDGFIKAWSLMPLENGMYSISEVGQVQTKFRLTCLTMYKPKPIGHLQTKQVAPTKPSKRVEEEMEKSDDEENDSPTSPNVSKSKSVKFHSQDVPKKKKKAKTKRGQISVSVTEPKKTKTPKDDDAKDRIKNKRKVKRLKQKTTK